MSVWLFLQNTILPSYSYMMLELLGIGYDRVSIITVVQTVVSMCSLYVWGTLNARYSNKYLLLRDGRHLHPLPEQKNAST
ncbi:hypothetical protein M3650_11175 [Paenibacillus sp. MER TA 81-3]|uniref:hypothetical protein n=1 Tax=Paenibacillus sp. MER TA 81-3 TaxID=2939573 RepID=UPI00203B0A11|nr:hypothetical protein [Paenibacillus sp. MER TA 81-3]MCM3339186.1 hypothetical protein [Paenibacillus sp. MER TA 81-3]